MYSAGYGSGKASNYRDDPELLAGLLCTDENRFYPDDYKTPHDRARIEHLEDLAGYRPTEDEAA